MQEQLFAFIKKEAAAVDARMREDLAALDCPLLPDILEHALFNGGKRVRPLLTLLAARIVDPDQASLRLYQLAIVFEYLHVASLLHDDVIDSAAQRRGRPSANTLWGTSSVILAGDYLHARAMAQAGKAGGVECLAIIGRATAAMVEAEFLQLENAREQSPVTENYYRVINGKTAALITAACESGAVFAGANDEQRRALTIYGHNLGLAFQIVDDLLDYLGDEGKTGKAVGNDLVEGKMTLPLILCLESASTGDRRLIREVLCLPAASRRPHFDSVKELIAAHAGFERARKKAEDLICEAQQQLDLFDACPAREALAGLAHYVITRDK